MLKPKNCRLHCFEKNKIRIKELTILGISKLKKIDSEILLQAMYTCSGAMASMCPIL
jgi:hypothetical protein